VTIAKEILAAIIAGTWTFALAKGDGHTWPVAAGLAVTAALTAGAGVRRVPNAPRP
jgi:hypothetical protein